MNPCSTTYLHPSTPQPQTSKGNNLLTPTTLALIHADFQDSPLPCVSSVNKLDMKKVFKNNDNDAENEDEDRGIIPTVAADAHLFEAARSKSKRAIVMIARADAKSHHVNRKENILAAKHQANKASNEEKFTDWKQSQLHTERREQERAVAENKIKEAKLKAIRDKKEDGSDGGSSQGKGGRGGDMSCVGMSTPSARYLLP